MALPSVTIHYAQTLDGRIATRTGESQWISGPASLRLAHELRTAHDAVMVGVGTILADNPRLTPRLVSGPSPLRVVLDSTLRLPLDARVLADTAARTLVATTERASAEATIDLRARAVEVLVVRQDHAGHVDLADLLERLGDRGIASVLIEGGRGVITAALQQRLADRLVVCIAPLLVGSGIEAVGDLNVGRLREALTFTESSFVAVGDDIVFDGQLDRRPAAAG